MSTPANSSTSTKESSEESKSTRSFFDLSHYEVITSVGINEIREYELFCQRRVSKLTVALLLLWFIMCSIFIFTTAIAYAKQRIIFVVVAAFYVVFRNPLFLLIIYLKSKRFLSFAGNAQSMFANITTVQSSICLGLFLIGRVINGECEHEDALHIYSCNPEQPARALPQDVVFALLFVPVMVSTVFKAVKWQSVFLSWLVAIVSIEVAMWIGDAPRTLPLLVFYIPISLVVMYETYRQDIILFLMSRKKDALLQANKDLSEEAQTELRFMIANMAHDLKTPLSAFMNGIELLKSLFAEMRKTDSPDEQRNLHLSITENIKNLFNVNQFMTMTVNRCIDYMKASKGIKLEPRLETINLQEVLSMPLNCMRDLQSRIAIIQKPIPSSVCSHIITDLQWFQENLFCLISNAVKYSSHGHISVSVQVIHSTHHLINVAKDKKRGGNSARQTNNSTVSESSFHEAHHESYAFLDNLKSPTALSKSRSEDTENESTFNTDPLCKMESGVSTLKSSDSSKRQFPRFNIGSVGAKKSRVYATSSLSIDTRQSYTIFEEEPAKREDFMLVEVEDTGIGLSDEVKQTLFTPFKQAQRRAGGTGLGLYSLAKRVDALGGYYGVSNRRDGEQGSIFWFAVPYRPDNTSVGMLARAISKSLEEANSRTDSPVSHSPAHLSHPLTAPAGTVSSSTMVPSSPSASAAAGGAAGGSLTIPAVGRLRILLVDDSPTILKMTCNLLKRYGHTVDQEENGADALEALNKARDSNMLYDVMLIDLNMPVMDGLEAMKRLRETERQLNAAGDGLVTHRQKVFAFTANSDREAMQEAMDAGADDFISKPFSIQTFNEKFLMLKANEMILEDVV